MFKIWDIFVSDIRYKGVWLLPVAVAASCGDRDGDEGLFC